MPTATSTSNDVRLPTTGALKQKAQLIESSQLPPSSTTSATLRTLYNRAARAFLLRDIPLTHSLIGSAFGIINSSDTVTLDSLKEHRRKWDILRITLESMLHSSPPSSQEDLPEALKEILICSPQSLLTSMYSRSLTLFSPMGGNANVDPAHLPTQVLTTLVYSSLRLDYPDFGRIMIEDWLSRRAIYLLADTDGESTKGGYEKILELYCLQILPRLEQWDYALEFLDYERELSTKSQEAFKKSLKSLQAEAMSSRQTNQTIQSSHTQSDWSSRSFSPAPSSSSSSLSTTSTNTVVPSTIRGPQHTHPTSNLVAHKNASTTSLSSDSTAIPLQPTRRPVLRSRTAESSTSPPGAFTSLPRPPIQAITTRHTNLGTFALIKASLAPYMTASNISTFFVIFIIIPLVSLSARARHRRQLRSGGSSVAGKSAEIVRNRLQGSREAGVLGQVWGETMRIICDTVKMAGSGLV